jgi:hypothetical protein
MLVTQFKNNFSDIFAPLSHSQFTSCTLFMLLKIKGGPAVVINKEMPHT